MDTCIRKPLIVTCSTDRSVRVWNYLESSSELVKYFAEEAFSVAIHPSGLYILVGFSDKLRLMNLLIDDIRPFKEFTIRGCREVWRTCILNECDIVLILYLTLKSVVSARVVNISQPCMAIRFKSTLHGILKTWEISKVTMEK